MSSSPTQSQFVGAGAAPVEPAPTSRGERPANDPVGGQASGDVAISVRGVGKCYEIYGRPIDRLKQTLWRGRRQFYREFWALRNVSFEVRRGEAVGIIGRNGSGKSTLLQIIAGTLRPTEGQVEVRGRVHALLELGSGFNFEFTGRENVLLNGAILGLPQREVAARFDEIAAFADIGAFINLPVKTYSTGMVIRLAFAVQALLEPDVLIVDEALAVGDAAFQSKCFRRIHQLQERGTTILLVSHDLTTVSTMCGRALLLEGGQPALLGPAREVTQEYYRRVQNAEPRTADAGGSVSAPALVAGALEPLGSSKGLHQGDGRAEITGIAIYDHRGQRTRALRARERFRVVLAVGFRAPLNNPHVGVGFRDVRNQLLLGGHTMYEGRRLGPVQAGQELAVAFEMPLNLNPGVYLLMFGVADHIGWSNWCENDVWYDYCEIEVYGDERAWGLINVSVDISVRGASEARA